MAIEYTSAYAVHEVYKSRPIGLFASYEQAVDYVENLFLPGNYSFDDEHSFYVLPVIKIKDVP